MWGMVRRGSKQRKRNEKRKREPQIKRTPPEGRVKAAKQKSVSIESF
jgi:hypothetical protein